MHSFASPGKRREEGQGPAQPGYLHDGLGEVLGAPVAEAGLHRGRDEALVSHSIITIISCLWGGDRGHPAGPGTPQGHPQTLNHAAQDRERRAPAFGIGVMVTPQKGACSLSCRDLGWSSPMAPQGGPSRSFVLRMWCGEQRG